MEVVEVEWKLLLKNRWLLFLAGVGAIMLITSSFFPSHASHSTTAALTTAAGTTAGHGQTGSTAVSTPQATASDTAADIERRYDLSLESILGQIQGIHGVTVMVTVNSSGILDVAKNNTSSDTVSGSGESKSSTKSETAQIYSGGSGSSGPYVLSSAVPQVKGVLVTVNADDFATAKSEIIQSITNVLDVPAYKISVEPQKRH